MKTYRIYVVDDDVFFTKLLKQHIENLVEQFDEAVVRFLVESFSSAEIFLKSLSERPDVVILDYQFEVNRENEVSNGSEVLKYLGQRFPRTRVIMVSVVKDQDKIISLIKDGAIEFVNKDNETLNVVRYMIKNMIREDLHDYYSFKDWQ